MVYVCKTDVTANASGSQPIVTMPPKAVQKELVHLLGQRGIGLKFGIDAKQRPTITLTIGGLCSAGSVRSLEGAHSVFLDLLADCSANHDAGTLGIDRARHYLAH